MIDVSKISRLAAVGVLAVATLLVGCSSIQTGDRALDARLTRLMDEIDAERRSARVPGLAIAIVQDDRVLVARGFGWRDIVRRKPVTANTLFAIGSSTKPMTTALTAMLIDAGTLGWDQPLSNHLPDFQLKDPDADATYRDVYLHRTGLTRMTMLWAANQVSRDAIMKRVVAAKPYADFREEFLYNNVAFMAGGIATAKAAGVDSWETLIRERLLTPLNMQRSNTSITEMLADVDFAQGYSWNERTERFDIVQARDLTAVAPAGAVNSNVAEMTRWLRMLLSGGDFAGQQLVTSTRLDEMWEPQIAVGGGSNYGLGWFVRYWNGLKTVEHGGNIDGYASTMGLIPEKGIGVIMLQNVSASSLQQKVLPMVWEALLDVAPVNLVSEKQPVIAERKWSEKELEPYRGRYHLEQLDVDCSVLLVDGKLAVDVPGQTVFTLKWPDERGRWKFEMTDTIEVSFAEPVEGVVPSMTMHQSVRMDFLRISDAPAEILPTDLPMNAPWTVEELSPLVGQFRVAPGPLGVWTLSVREDRLHALIPGQQHWPLRWPDDEGWWAFEIDQNQQIRFVTDEEGRVSGFAFRRLLVMPMPRVDTDEALATVLDELLAGRGTLADSEGAWHIRGSYSLTHQGIEGSYESWLDSRANIGERTYLKIDLNPFGQTTTFTEGLKGWVESDIEQPQTLQGYDAARVRAETLLRMIGDWRTIFDEAKVVREDRLDSKPVYVVTAKLGDKTPLTRFVDQESGRVVRDEFVTEPNGLGSLLLKTDYDDYRNIDGFEVPFRLRTENPSVGVIQIQIESIETKQPWPTEIQENPNPDEPE